MWAAVGISLLAFGFSIAAFSIALIVMRDLHELIALLK
jgi:hypothetical protein